MNMNLLKWGGSALAVILFGSVAVLAEDANKPADDAPATAQPAAADVKAADEATTKEDKKAAKRAARKARLTKPWKDIASLTDEQKEQITAVHRKALDEIKAIEAREREEIMALLNDQQKTELAALEEKQAADRKAKRPAKRNKGGKAADDATKPEGGTEPAAKASE